jgi:2-hydroxy-3-keto-5-methylthiopentenyl-1-phosphate phosphatase
MVILCDFDDTAADRNIATLLLDRFHPDPVASGIAHWHEARQRFLRREISLAEYQEISFRRLPATHGEQAAYVQGNANLRPGFTELASYCSANNVDLAIVSHGLDFYIQALLEQENVGHIPYFAVTTGREDGATTFAYTFAEAQCGWWPGNCKCKIVEEFRARGQFVIYAGDGASDTCPARRADYVFARDSLLQFCREHGVPHEALPDFHVVLQYIRSRIEGPHD